MVLATTVNLPAHQTQGRVRPGVRRGMAHTVEMAIVAPIFFLMVLGVIEVGRAFMVTHLLNNCARTGCRVGIIDGTSSSTIDAAVSNALSGQGISGQTTTVYINGAVADASTAQSGDQITVVVSVSAASMSWLPVPKYMVGNLTGEYALRRE